MPHDTPEIHILSGPNGAGKTTFAKTYLPTVGIKEFLNADMLALGLNPLHPQTSAIEASKLLLSKWNTLVQKRKSFAFESTLSGYSYFTRLQKAKSDGYLVHIHYLWLPSVKHCLERIRNRVKKGGHTVPFTDVQRRYPKSIRNFLTLYMPLSDNAYLWDVFSEPISLVAKWKSDQHTVFIPQSYETFRGTVM